MKKLFMGVFLAAVMTVMTSSQAGAYLTPELHANSVQGFGSDIINPEYAIDGDNETFATSNEANRNGVLWGYPVSIPEGYYVNKVDVKMHTNGVNEYDPRVQCMSSDWSNADNISDFTASTGEGTDLTTFTLSDSSNTSCFWANNQWFNFRDGSTFLLGVDAQDSNYVDANTYAESYIQIQYCSMLGGECTEEVLDPAEAPEVVFPSPEPEE